MLHQSHDKMQCIKTFLKHLVKQQQRIRHIATQCIRHDLKIVLRIQHIQYLYRLLVSYFLSTKRYQLVKDTQRITHTTICFLCHHIQRLLLYCYTLLIGYILQLINDISYRDTLKIVHLTTTQYRCRNLMLLCRCQNKYSIRWRLFQGLQERVERTLRQHMNLVYDINTILTYLRGNTYLVYQRADILYRVITCSIQLMDIETSLLVEGST